jgi:signal transduction histidine kinase
MEQEVISKIFEPFFTKKETRKGYGLGLFVVHNIIEEHGGTIDVESQVGHGTTFLIRLPLREGKHEQ